MVKAVSALTAAFRLVQLDSCGQSVEEACLREVLKMMMLFMSILVCLREVGMMIMIRKKIIIMILTMMIEHSCGQSVEEGCLRVVLMIMMRKKSFLLWFTVISFVNVLNSQPPLSAESRPPR